MISPKKIRITLFCCVAWIYLIDVPFTSAFTTPSFSLHRDITAASKRSNQSNRLLASTLDNDSNNGYTADLSNPLERLANAASEWYVENFQPNESPNPSPDKDGAVQIKTLVRVGVPSITLALIAALLYTPLCIFIANDIVHNDQGVFTVLSQDSSQYVQNILTTSGLMFSILTGYTYYFMYQQQEQLFLALFNEVSEAKSLLEQVSLVCTGREMYPQILECIQSYVEQDLKYCTRVDPAVFLSTRGNTYPMSSAKLEFEPLQDEEKEDPLEAIMYMTSVGTPSSVYDTILSLRRARANRLGALQQKLPELQIYLLRILAVVVLFTFPVCGSGSQVLGGLGILHVQAAYFGIMVFAIAMVLNVSYVKFLFAFVHFHSSINVFVLHICSTYLLMFSLYFAFS